LLTTYNPKIIVCGIDEAGRGPLAGPVVAGAVILPKGFYHPLLNDSKKLTEKQRDLLRPIIENEAIEWAAAAVSPAEIDKINILQASFVAMHRCVDQLKNIPDLLLIDGNRFNPYLNISHECMIKGDGRFLSIAAASIIAKTHRDEIMYRLHKKYPVYGWHRNKGYPTKAHREAIAKHGLSPHHRLSFRQFPKQLKINQL